MAVTRVIEFWMHDFRTASVTFKGTVADDVEGTIAPKDWTVPDAQLPQGIKDWEQNVIASHGAVSAPPMQP